MLKQAGFNQSRSYVLRWIFYVNLSFPTNVHISLFLIIEVVFWKTYSKLKEKILVACKFFDRLSDVTLFQILYIIDSELTCFPLFLLKLTKSAVENVVL